MDPVIISAINKMASMLIMSELTGPIDDLKFYWKIISPQPWWVIAIIALRFAWPVITRKYRVRI